MSDWVLEKVVTCEHGNDGACKRSWGTSTATGSIMCPGGFRTRVTVDYETAWLLAADVIGDVADPRALCDAIVDAALGGTP